MRDGVVLRADVYRPDDGERHPVLIQRNPYNKEFMPFAAPTLDPVRAAAAGYAVIIQDARGRWASEGDFFLYRNELNDGYDTVEWAAQLPFCDGNVGAYGISYMGASTWQAAYSAHPALKAVSPTTAPNNFHRHFWPGGVLQLGLITTWTMQAIAPNALMRAQAASPDFVPRFMELVEAIDDFETTVRHVPLTDLPVAHREDASFLPFFFELLEHPMWDDFNASILRTDLHRDIRAPVLITAGWYDTILEGDLSHFTQLRKEAVDDDVREKSRIVVGPWVHAEFAPVVGDLGFGLRSSGYVLDLKEDLTKLNLRWFDRWLKGERNGVDEEPRVKLFVQGVNRWRDEDDWPLARATPTPWYLHPGESLSPNAPPTGAEPGTYRYDPADPCPTLGGGLLMPHTYKRGPVDQRPLQSRPDVLWYSSDVLLEEVEVIGPVSAIVYASTTATDTDWVVKLCDAHPDGRIFNVCDGILRARYRDGFERGVPVEPGRPEKYVIDMVGTAIVFKPGHRIVVLITSSDFPRYDRNPNTGQHGFEATATMEANQTIFQDASRPSHVLLPIVAR